MSRLVREVTDEQRLNHKEESTGIFKDNALKLALRLDPLLGTF